jgi:hypothetical protein
MLASSMRNVKCGDTISHPRETTTIRMHLIQRAARMQSDSHEFTMFVHRGICTDSVVSRLTIPTCGFQRHKGREPIRLPIS